MEDNIIFPNPPVNKIHLLVILFFPVIGIHGDANSRGAGGPAEKDLGLPARSRFGEGRAAPLKDWLQALQDQYWPHFH
jgi:hypothetical protein